MKKSVLAAVLALCFVLSGCSSMFERDYISATRHVEYHAEDSASLVQAESYQGLVSALLYFVTNYFDTGLIHLSNYTGDVESDLKKACAEIMEEDAIGAYALEDIQHELVPVVSYYEVRLNFTYEHSKEEVQNVWTVATSAYMYRRAGEAMSELQEKCTVNAYLFNQDKAELLTEMHQIWIDSPLVLEEPRIRVKLYPEKSEYNQVVEFTFEWEDKEDLADRSGLTLAAAKRFLEDCAPGEGESKLTAPRLAAYLLQRVVVDETQGGTAYDALVGGSANRKGVTMALKLLCDLSALDTTVVEGRLNGESAWWIIAQGGEYNYHLDPNGACVYASDEEQRALGYEWSTARYPVCETPSEPEQATETEDGGESTDAEEG